MTLRFVLFGAAMLAIVPAAPPVLAQAALKELPKEMTGIWGFDAEACKDEDSDGRVAVEPRQVSSFAALFKLQTISKLPDGTLRASTRRFDEGEARRPRDTLDLKLVSPDTLSIKSGREQAVSYRRCKTSAKAR
jgi:hypothetical protein